MDISLYDNEDNESKTRKAHTVNMAALSQVIHQHIDTGSHSICNRSIGCQLWYTSVPIIKLARLLEALLCR